MFSPQDKKIAAEVYEKYDERMVSALLHEHPEIIGKVYPGLTSEMFTATPDPDAEGFTFGIGKRDIFLKGDCDDGAKDMCARVGRSWKEALLRLTQDWETKSPASELKLKELQSWVSSGLETTTTKSNSSSKSPSI